ncbi:hypothetical protein NUW58_g2944 [Xylaria curta]|uniref:Uncharacterized protein n=1 Tax=Xylaria curta TaxID=42375 RepID=A0ACC1PFV6_9PEZI|nr:hypothetical protein NUW58_g2944 [Xylaria curta]
MTVTGSCARSFDRRFYHAINYQSCPRRDYRDLFLPRRQHGSWHRYRLLNTATPSGLAKSPSKQKPQTLTEKIIQQHTVGSPGKSHAPRPGDYVTLSPFHCMTHDNTKAVQIKWTELGADKVHSPSQLIFGLDHDVSNSSPRNLKKYAEIEAFAAEQGITFYPRYRGIVHQIMVEEGHAWPGTMVVASDSHSNMYGGVGCLGTPIVRTDAMAVWQTGVTWYQLPPVARLNLIGEAPAGITGKDIIVALCTLFKSDVLNHAVEINGSSKTMASLSIDDRLSISNMSTEWGALSCLFPIDKTLEDWLRQKADAAKSYENGRTTTVRINHERIDQLFANPPRADPDAVYAKQLWVDLSTLSPYVAGPDSVKIATPLHNLSQKNIKIDRAYLVSCTNSRASDIARAAQVFQDAAKANPQTKLKLADGVKMYISAASAPEQEAAEAAGHSADSVYWFRPRLLVIGGFDGAEVFGDVWMLELAVHAYYSQISHFTIEVTSSLLVLARSETALFRSNHVPPQVLALVLLLMDALLDQVLVLGVGGVDDMMVSQRPLPWRASAVSKAAEATRTASRDAHGGDPRAEDDRVPVRLAPFPEPLHRRLLRPREVRVRDAWSL